MSWEDIENAMQSAIVKASRFDARNVLWSYQDSNQPADDYIVIRFGGETTIGIDRIATEQDLTRPNGQEMKQSVRGVREVPLEIEVFTTDTTGSDSARRVASLITSRLRLDSVRAPLQKAGISPFDPGPVKYIPDIPSVKFRGRAIVTVRCYVPVIDCDEYTGYIARVRGITTVIGEVSGVPVDVPFDSGA